MTPEERQLITGLFERMRSFGAPEKDRDAEALIYQQLRALPDAAYMLVQSVLVQEQALQNAQGQIQELEQRLADMQEPPRKSGSFLGGFWGHRDPEPRPASVPQVGARATPSAYDTRQPWSQPGAQQPAGPPQQPAPAAGGGFMRSAISTAAGVAGGVLLADSLRNMLGGGHAGAPWGSGSAHAGQDAAGQAERDAADDRADDAADDQAARDAADDRADDAADDQAAQDAEDDAADDADSGYDDGGDFGGGDGDIDV